MPRIVDCLRQLVCLTAVVMLVACVTEKPPREPETFGYQREMLPKHTAPAEMDDLVGKLILYRATQGRLPMKLSELVDADLTTADALAALPEYGYSGQGLGYLQDGRLVLLVDSDIRVPNQAWCIVQKATKPGEPPALETSLVSMAQLRAAARSAK